MQIDRGGLDVVMPQMMLDVRNGIPVVKHVNCFAMAKTMDGINVPQPLFRKSLAKVFPANTIDTMAGERLTPLIDKEPVLKHGPWGYPVFPNVQLKQITGFGLKLYEPKTIALAQDTERFLNGIKIIELQGCDFTGPGTGIVEQMEQGVIPEPFFSF
jgi:hypothetical protein